MNPLVIIAIAILMEPFTTFIHRVVMHGIGWGWHKSHHDRIGQLFEKNDYFPVVFSALAILLFSIGTQNIFIREVATGITIYGVFYFFVHEIVIHSRFIHIKNNNALFRYWRFGHNVHHQFHKSPYGFIVPITNNELALKARENPRDLIHRHNKH